MYRFLNHSRFNWRRFLLLLSSDTVKRIQPLTSEKRVTAFVVDDSMFKVSTDARSFGGIFHAICDEVKELDWAIALTTLVELVEQIALKTGKRITKWIQTQLLQWIGSLPSYIEAYLPISMCES